MVKFVLNGKEVSAVDFTLNTICDLEDMGVSIEMIENYPFKAIRGYVAVCLNTSKEEAGNLIQEHIVGGGKLDVILEAMTKKFEDSDFFRSIT